MKRRSPPSSCSSTSSSSCIGPAAAAEAFENKSAARAKPKRVRARKTPSGTGDDSAATSPKSRSSVYRGVTRHRWTGRFEAHLWDKSTWNSIQSKKGRQIYLGAYDNEDDAARTYDLAALKYWGPSTILNFPVESYAKEIEEMQKMSREEYLASLRRRSSGFSRGVSKYRGVARHHHNGRWEARIGRIAGNKYLYLGTFSTQEAAAAAYDRAAIEFRGPNAVTNFDISNYADKLPNLPPNFQIKQEIPQEKEEVQAPNPEPPKVQPDEAQVQQHQHDEIQAPVPVASHDSQPMMAMDGAGDGDYLWDDLCLDLSFDSPPLSDIPLDKAAELLGWLDRKSFQDDDIECIFDYEMDFVQEDAMSGTGGCKGGGGEAAAAGGEGKGQDLKSSNSSSSLSTMASVCSSSSNN